MVDQNPQVNQNVNNQNENDELFGGSDDIFENSDLLQPINSEVDTAHQVIKSQNDLNNFSGEVQNNQTSSEENLGNIMDEPEESNNIQQPEPVVADDLFEEPQEKKESNENFENLYDENEVSNSQPQNNYSENDDIFDSPETKQEVQDIPEVVEYVDEPEENEIKDEIEEDAENEPQEEIQDKPEEGDKMEENMPKAEDNDVANIPENKGVDDNENDVDDFDDLDEIDSVDDIPDIDEDEEDDEEKDEEDDEEEDEEEQKGIPNQNEEVQIKTPEDDEEDEEEEIGGVSSTRNSEVEEDKKLGDNFVDEETEEDEQKTDEEEQETITIQDYEKYDPNLFKTDVQKKYGELQRKTEKIHELVGKNQEVGFDLLGGNDDRKKIIYRILSGGHYIEIEKEELNKEDESTITNILEFILDEDLEGNKSVKLFVNDIELYDEIKDLQNDPNKKMQVLEKMNKFIFLLDEEYKKIQKYKKEKEERNAVKGVFRNF